MNPQNHSDDFAGQTKTERKKAIERLMGEPPEAILTPHKPYGEDILGLTF